MSNNKKLYDIFLSLYENDPHYVYVVGTGVMNLLSPNLTELFGLVYVCNYIGVAVYACSFVPENTVQWVKREVVKRMFEENDKFTFTPDTALDKVACIDD